MNQYIIELEYRLVVEHPSNEVENVAEDFIARLSELATSDAHILNLSVNAYPLPPITRAYGEANSAE